MICPFCGTPVMLTHHTDGASTTTEMRCPKCSEKPGQTVTEGTARTLAADAALGTHTLLDLIDWTLARIPAAAHRAGTPAELVARSLRCMAVVAASASPFEQRREVTGRLLAGLLSALRGLLDGKDGA